MLIPEAYAQAAAQQPQGGGLFLPLMMVGILVFMYFTTIRPQRKRLPALGHLRGQRRR